MLRDALVLNQDALVPNQNAHGANQDAYVLQRDARGAKRNPDIPLGNLAFMKRARRVLLELV